MKSLKGQLVELLPVLRRYACSLTGNIADGDDLVQQAVERALRKQQQFDRNKEARSWMFTIMKNIWIDEKRRSARQGQMLDIDDQHDLAGHDGRLQAEQRQAASRVLEAMSALPDTQREVAFHVLVDGKSYKETADLLNIPTGTVMSSLSRARARLAGELLENQRIQ